MIRCTACEEDLDDDMFSPQKTNPAKLYRWCDGCRKSRGSLGRSRYDYASEMRALRDKNRQSLALDEKQVKTIRILAGLNKNYAEIAEAYNVSVSVVSRAVRGIGLYGEI
jgi:hypothetical protein